MLVRTYQGLQVSTLISLEDMHLQSCESLSVNLLKLSFQTSDHCIHE